MKKNKLVPELRFSGFGDEWGFDYLKNLTKINQGLQIPISERYLEPIKNSFFYITNEFLKENSSLKYYILNPNDSVRCDTNDVLMTRTGNTGQVVTGVQGAFHNNFFKIKFDKKKINKDFLVFFLRLYTTQCTILRLAGTSTIPDLNHGDFYRLRIHFPTLPEQQKIANFLTKVDARIQLLQDKKNKLEAYKKGVMQQIFSQKIRFTQEDGTDFGDWEEKRFEEVYFFQTTNSYSRDNLNYEFGEVKNIHYGDIHTKFRSQFNIEQEHVPFINIEVNISRLTDEHFLSVGDLVIADASEDYNDIGKCIEIVKTNNEKIIAGLHTFLAKKKSYKMAVGFASYLMKTYKIRLAIMKIAQGTKVLSISTKRLATITLNLPTLPEQQKIANFLSALDQQIEQVGKQVEQMQVWKKGLLQKMFV